MFPPLAPTSPTLAPTFACNSLRLAGTDFAGNYAKGGDEMGRPTWARGGAEGCVSEEWGGWARVCVVPTHPPHTHTRTQS